MKTILIVEDIEPNRELLAQLLEDDHRLVFAEDGVAALARVAETKPDLILMDLSLPRMDGWEATRRLKADAATERIPVINPATLEEIGRTPLSPASEVDQAAMAAGKAFPAWRRTPVTERVQYLFKL